MGKCTPDCICGRHRRCRPGCACGRHDNVMNRSMSVDLEPTEVGWLAGLLEGEGSFMTVRNVVAGKEYFYPKVIVNMTDRDVIANVATMLGTSVYELPQYRPDRKPAWRASVQGSRAAAIMQAVLPWMGERRSAKIREILTNYAKQQPTELRRRRSNAIAAQGRERSAGRFVRSAS